jgi:hypothetical protein
MELRAALWGVLVVFLLANRALATTCDPVHVDNQVGTRTGVFDQGEVEDCYANAASTLIDYWRSSHNPPVGDTNRDHRTFPLACAIDYSTKHKGSSLHSGGSAFDVLMDLKETGSCDPTRSPIQAPSGELGDWLGAQYQTFLDSKGIKRTEEASDDSDCFNPPSLAKIPDLKSVEALIGGPDKTLAELKKIIDAACPPAKRQKVRGYSVVYTPLKQGELSSAVDGIFKKRPAQPISVGICANILEQKSYPPLNYSNGVPSPSKSCEKHELVIVGREKNSDGKCVAILQNSWGTSCHPYDWPCNNGKVTVPMDKLGEQALEVTHLEEEAQK